MKLNRETAKALRENGYRSCAYIYPDGLAVVTREDVKVAGQRSEVSVWRLFKGENRIHIDSSRGPNGADLDWQNRPFRDSGRIVLHNATLLLDGLADVALYFCNGTESEESRGIPTRTTMTLTTNSGLRIHLDEEQNRSSDICVQTNGGTLQAVIDGTLRYEAGTVVQVIEAESK